MLAHLAAFGSFLLNILIAVVSFLITTLFINWAKPAGGFVSSSVQWSRIKFPRIGGFLNRLFDDALHASFLFKAAGLCISCSGSLLLLLALQCIFPDWLKDHALLWGVLIAVFWETLCIMDRVNRMETPTFDIDLDTLTRLTGIDIREFGHVSQMRFARMNYTTRAVMDLLTIVVSYGVVLFCAGKIGLLGDPLLFKMTPLQAVASTSVFLRFTIGAIPLPTNGPWALIIGVFYGLSLLVYTAFFLSLTSKLIDEKPDSKPDEPKVDPDDQGPGGIDALIQDMEKFLQERIDNNPEPPRGDEDADVKQPST